MPSHYINQCWALSVGILGTNLREILIANQTVSFNKMHLKIPSVKWRPFCPGEDELNHVSKNGQFPWEQLPELIFFGGSFTGAGGIHRQHKRKGQRYPSGSLGKYCPVLWISNAHCGKGPWSQWIMVDSFTIPFHCPNSRHLPAIRVKQWDCQWPLKDGENCQQSCEPRKHYDWGIPKLHLAANHKREC